MWFETTYHFSVIATMFKVDVVLYDLEQNRTSLWKPGDNEVPCTFMDPKVDHKDSTSTWMLTGRAFA